MSAPRAVIVGTGRSGSGYIAQVLTGAGIKCGHEGYWNPFDPIERDEDLDADSTWCALAFGLRDFDGHIWHQVRHPLAVISSLVKNPTTEGPYLELQASLVSHRMLWRPGHWIDFAISTWLTYTRAAEDVATQTWRVEDVTVELVTDLARRLGSGLPARDIGFAFAGVDKQTNYHGPGEHLDWIDLVERGANVGLVRACYDAAKTWGYA